MYVSGMLFSSHSALDFNFVLILKINIPLINTLLPQPSHSLVLNLFFQGACSYFHSHYALCLENSFDPTIKTAFLGLSKPFSL